MPHGFRTRLASREEHHIVLAVRRSAYARRGAGTNLDESLTDADDLLPHCRSYLLVSPQGRFAGTIRPSISSKDFGWPSLPMSRYYPREMEQLRTREEPIIQSSLFGVVPEFRQMGLFPTLSLLRAVCASGLAFDADLLITLSSARTSKIRFWKRLGWHVAAEPIAHPLDPAGAVLLLVSIRNLLRIARENDMFSTVADFVTPPQRNGRFPPEV